METKGSPLKFLFGVNPDIGVRDIHHDFVRVHRIVSLVVVSSKDVNEPVRVGGGAESEPCRGHRGFRDPGVVRGVVLH